MNKSENEVWKTYPEFDFIQGSNLGRVRTVDRYVKQGDRECFVRGQILKQRRKADGYMQVGFSANGKYVCRTVHRIVASCFIDNRSHLPEVNHKDCNPTNNHIKNLEWCTHEYNITYREKHGVSAKEAVPKKPVIAIDLKGREALYFESQNETSRQLGICIANINMVIKGRRNQAGGFWFVDAEKSAVKLTKEKFGNNVASKVEQLMSEKDYN